MNGEISFQARLDGERSEVVVFASERQRAQHIRKHVLAPIEALGEESAVLDMMELKREILALIRGVKRTQCPDNGCLRPDRSPKEELCITCEMFDMCSPHLLKVEEQYAESIRRQLEAPPMEGRWHVHCHFSTEGIGISREDIQAVGNRGMIIALEKMVQDGRFNIKTGYMRWPESPNMIARWQELKRRDPQRYSNILAAWRQSGNRKHAIDLATRAAGSRRPVSHEEHEIGLKSDER
jgi:hypothetical protein